MTQFNHTTAKIALWNLAVYNGITDEQYKNQVKELEFFLFRLTNIFA